MGGMVRLGLHQGESLVRVRKAHRVPGVGARGPVETDKHKEQLGSLWHYLAWAIHTTISK